MQILKFVLWTWPSAMATVAGFLDSRVKLHEILAHTNVDGFLGSAVCKVDSAPWAGAFLFENSPWSVGHKTVFEEWYLFHGGKPRQVLAAGPWRRMRRTLLRAQRRACPSLVRSQHRLHRVVQQGVRDYDDLLERLAPAMHASRASVILPEELKPYRVTRTRAWPM